MAKLNEQQKKKLPPELKIILAKMEHDPASLNRVKYILNIAAQKIAQHAINHSTFCDGFLPPNKMPNELLKVYGVSNKELKNAFYKIGFDQRNAMHRDTYYHTLLVAYLIGLNNDDETLRKIALFLIAIRIWNGRKIKSFRYMCDHDTARYALNYVLANHHTYKKAGSAFNYIDQYSVPHIDNKYKDEIANNLDNKKGLLKIIETMWSRYEQLFRSIRNAYYKTHAEGKKEVITDKYQNQYGDGDMVETKESFSGTVERLVDKIEKNSLLKKEVLMSKQAKDFLKNKYMLSDAAIGKLNDWIEDEDNHEDLKYFLELLFTELKPRNEHDICKYDVSTLAMKITSSKKNPNMKKAKEIINQALESILGDKFKTLGTQSIYRYQPIISHAFVLYAKLLLCKKI